MVCKTFKKSINKVCINDLSKKITLQKRNIQSSYSLDTNATSEFTDIAIVFAMIKTNDITEYLDEVNSSQAISTIFIIRYTETIGSYFKDGNIWVLYNNIRYKINSINNIDYDNKYVKLLTVERGLNNKEANNF